MFATAFPTRLFLDSGDPTETQVARQTFGWLDGQTTNPTLVAKSPMVQARLAQGQKMTPAELWLLYKNTVQSIAQIIPRGSVSIEVYADVTTSAPTMLAQAHELFGWIPNAHIKFPVTPAGVEAAARAVEAGMRVNMTLCFSQAQAAAVHAATRGAVRGQVLLSPFIGRLDDGGENGLDLIKNIITMYRANNSHVEVLAASIRSPEHALAAAQLGADIITAPLAIWQRVLADERRKNLVQFSYDPKNLQPIAGENYDLSQPWTSFDLTHPLTAAGVERFASDWNTLLQ